MPYKMMMKKKPSAKYDMMTQSMMDDILPVTGSMSKSLSIWPLFLTPAFLFCGATASGAGCLSELGIDGRLSDDDGRGTSKANHHYYYSHCH